MLRDWLKAFRSDPDSLTDHILDLFQSMLNDAQWMFEGTRKLLLAHVDQEPTLKNDILARDLKLNQNERKVRQWIVQHLALHPTENLGLSLVIFSGVKDAERLGDYCKNLLEVAAKTHWTDLGDNHRLFIEKAYATLSHQFSVIGQAFADSDIEKAQASIDLLLPLQNQCQDQVIAVLESPRNGDPHAAAATVLITRYLKRIADHLCNIATGVTQPVHQIDHYRDDGES